VLHQGCPPILVSEAKRLGSPEAGTSQFLKQVGVTLKRSLIHRALPLLGMLIFLVTTLTQAQEVSVSEFRQKLLAWAEASAEFYEPAADIAEKVEGLSDAQLAEWLYHIPNPEQFLNSLEAATSQLQEKGDGALLTPFGPDREELSSAPTSLQASITPFAPAYPPNTGPYRNVIIDSINSFRIPVSNTESCSVREWANYIGVWWPLDATFDALDAACVVGGCDPTGIVCATVCGTLETAKLALKTAAIPVELCDLHGSAVAGAEIEATYENLLQLLGLSDDIFKRERGQAQLASPPSSGFK
jgi:hypothetical protein